MGSNERRNSFGLTWADQWDYKLNDEPEKNESTVNKIKSAAITGFEKTKYAAFIGAKKVMDGTSTGIRWYFVVKSALRLRCTPKLRKVIVAFRPGISSHTRCSTDSNPATIRGKTLRMAFTVTEHIYLLGHAFGINHKFEIYEDICCPPLHWSWHLNLLFLTLLPDWEFMLDMRVYFSHSFCGKICQQWQFSHLERLLITGLGLAILPVENPYNAIRVMYLDFNVLVLTSSYRVRWVRVRVTLRIHLVGFLFPVPIHPMQ
eukprot:Gb_23619 [translate_table: standard]